MEPGAIQEFLTSDWSFEDKLRTALVGALEDPCERHFAVEVIFPQEQPRLSELGANMEALEARVRLLVLLAFLETTELNAYSDLGALLRAFPELPLQACRKKGVSADPSRDRTLGGGPEDRLPAEFARYLFDQGLSPLSKPMTGGLQPDLLDPAARFYVEAKQYDSSARGDIVSAVAQVMDTVGRLRGSQYEVDEAFRAVFRRRGHTTTCRTRCTRRAAASTSSWSTWRRPTRPGVASERSRR
jgi:hypothetical protein